MPKLFESHSKATCCKTFVLFMDTFSLKHSMLVELQWGAMSLGTYQARCCNHDDFHDMLQRSNNREGRFMTTSRACACHSLELPNWQNVMLERHGRIEVSLIINIFLAIILYMKERCLISQHHDLVFLLLLKPW